MTFPKESVLKWVSEVSDEASYEDIQYEIYVRQKVQDGLKEVENGNTVNHEEAQRRFRTLIDGSYDDA
ncbi:MAG: hypothetical protein H6751_16370 [Candidatus Omnitrophica bacterium]|nr:hypothetical protein [Candidatus Omnitrophota bacterium]MCB9784541.1 hypothetical protein [Candidatus Omnitrophota bacterium]